MKKFVMLSLLLALFSCTTNKTVTIPQVESSGSGGGADAGVTLCDAFGCIGGVGGIGVIGFACTAGAAGIATAGVGGQ